MAGRFYIVDVFAERPYAGNQLAVVVGADDLSVVVGGDVIPTVQGELL